MRKFITLLKEFIGVDDRTYKAKILCTNCLFKGIVCIPFGVLITEVECLKCGNKSIERT